MSQTTTEAVATPSIELRRLDDISPTPTISSIQVRETELNDHAPSISSTAEDESNYPTGRKLAVMLAAIGLVLIMDALDSNIVAVAVPALTQHWHSIKDVGWYSAVFRLCTCSFQFMFGKLYKLFNVKIVFLVSIGLFLLGSTVCATAPTSIAFIVGRAICGFANAGIIAGSFTVVRLALPLRKRPLWASILAAIEGTATIGSPLLGGVLVENLGWRWCFWINLPTGALTWIVIAFTVSDLGQRETLSVKAKLKELDLPGTLLFFPAMTSLFMALTWAGTKLSWSSPIIIALLCIFVVLLAVFIVEQWLRQDSATLPPRLFQNRSVLAGALFSLTCNGAVTVFEYYLPTYLQAVKGYGPAKSGYLLIPLIVSFLLSVLLQGSGVNVIGYYVPFMWATSFLQPIASGLMTTFSVSTPLSKFLSCSAFLGFATGIGFQAPQVAVQNTLPEKDAHMGLAIILFAQHFGPALSIAATQTILTNRLSENIKHFAPGVDASSVENSGLDDLKAHLDGTNLEDALLALNKSLVQSWYLPVALACVTIIGSACMKWTNVKQKRR